MDSAPCRHVDKTNPEPRTSGSGLPQGKIHAVVRDFDRDAVLVPKALKLCLHIPLISSDDCGPAVDHNHFWNTLFPTPSELCLYGGVADHLTVPLLVTNQRARNGCTIADIHSDT